MAMSGQHRPRPAPPRGWGGPVGTGIGASIGLIFGLMLGQFALGLVFGAALGLVAGTTLTTASVVPAGRRRLVLVTAIAILAAGIVSTAAVLLD